MSDAAEPFELPIRVEPADIDELGHVNNVTYLRWVQDAAVAHWTAAAPAEELARLFWIVLRHEIDYLHAAHLEDRIAARTWVGTATRMRFERLTEIVCVTDRRVLARARTLWCPIDAVTRKPTAVSAEVRARFSIPATSPPSKSAGGPY
ncbi:MAG TPA: thioesterase family protein [Bryobacteraceae bacterium]|nr:thioesterase family protein [Bryobacteraceae bacterium]